MQKKILVVEDDLEMASLLTFNLKKAGYAVGTAKDGVEAVKKARSVRPDLILLDLVLPELDGFAVCELLRREKPTARTPIIMLTALSGSLSRVAGLGCGADEFHTKPFNIAELQASIARYLNRDCQAA